jgi:hypothetical protein
MCNQSIYCPKFTRSIKRRNINETEIYNILLGKCSSYSSRISFVENGIWIIERNPSIERKNKEKEKQQKQNINDSMALVCSIVYV